MKITTVNNKYWRKVTTGAEATTIGNPSQSDVLFVTDDNTTITGLPIRPLGVLPLEANEWYVKSNNSCKAYVSILGGEFNHLEKIEMDDLGKMDKGDTKQVNVTLTPTDATVDLVYSSSDATIATIDSSGEITAIEEGFANIKIIDKNSNLQIFKLLEVEKVIATSIDMTLASDVRKGKTEQVTLDIIPSNAETDISYSSSNNAAATVDDTGLVTGIAEGVAIITATDSISGLGDTSEITINPPVATSITINLASDVEVGATEQATTTKEPNDAEINLSYSSSNEEIATVDDTGLVTGIAEGVAIITVTDNISGLDDTTDISVTAV